MLPQEAHLSDLSETMSHSTHSAKHVRLLKLKKNDSSISTHMICENNIKIKKIGSLNEDVGQAGYYDGCKYNSALKDLHQEKSATNLVC